MTEVTARAQVAALRANANFYRAFNAGDFAAMQAVWAEHAPLSCFHPGMPALIGREAVLDSWRHILREAPGYQMRCDHAQVHLLGEAALISCYEGNADQPAHLAATNVFVLEHGSWRMVHHHAGPLAQPIATVAPAGSLN
jgi:ketosteroid isomerase-like protein